MVAGVTVTSRFRGYGAEMLDGEWVFSDTKESIASTWLSRPCGHCGDHNTAEGHDACLGTLPGVMNACCGHGVEVEAYVQFPDGSVVRGAEAVAMQRDLRGR